MNLKLNDDMNRRYSFNGVQMNLKLNDDNVLCCLLGLEVSCDVMCMIISQFPLVMNKLVKFTMLQAVILCSYFYSGLI